jgi:hypothetical protein
MNSAAHRPNTPYEPIQVAVEHVELREFLELLLWAGGLLAVALMVTLLL